ncbi:hypothetical protein H6F51_00345 [Cyanobacteria bacterium FACHB-DQ100]|nr:hypothetical protein [Cyanobacteria bacterium FACHB-DQ100]
MYVSGGDAKPSYHVLKFDGSEYLLNPSTASEVPPGTIISGQSVSADQIFPNIGLRISN